MKRAALVFLMLLSLSGCGVAKRVAGVSPEPQAFADDFAMTGERHTQEQYIAIALGAECQCDVCQNDFRGEPAESN